jgi:hypothetical protein
MTSFSLQLAFSAVSNDCVPNWRKWPSGPRKVKGSDGLCHWFHLRHMAQVEPVAAVRVPRLPQELAAI